MYLKTLLALIIVVISVGCKETNTNNTTIPTLPNGNLVDHTNCKSTILDSVPNNNDCIEYSYDIGTKILKLKHINAAFNCCPGEITSNITFDKDAITISEKEKTADCLCDCLFDINYQLNGIEPTDYVLTVVEPYCPKVEEKLLVNLNLKEKSSGRICVQRYSYPWSL